MSRHTEKEKKQTVNEMVFINVLARHFTDICHVFLKETIRTFGVYRLLGPLDG